MCRTPATKQEVALTVIAQKLSPAFFPTGEHRRVTRRWRFAVVAFYGPILAGLIMFAAVRPPSHATGASEVPAVQFAGGRIEPSAQAAEAVRDPAADAGISNVIPK
jgi:hypothetical protein